MFILKHARMIPKHVENCLSRKRTYSIFEFRLLFNALFESSFPRLELRSHMFRTWSWMSFAIYIETANFVKTIWIHWDGKRKFSQKGTKVVREWFEYTESLNRDSRCRWKVKTAVNNYLEVVIYGMKFYTQFYSLTASSDQNETIRCPDSNLRPRSSCRAL